MDYVVHKNMDVNRRTMHCCWSQHVAIKLMKLNMRQRLVFCMHEQEIERLLCNSISVTIIYSQR